jgi:hypothetical protein
MKATTATIILVILGLSLQAPMDTKLKRKMQATKPNYNSKKAGALIASPYSYAKRFAKTVSPANLDSVLKLSQTFKHGATTLKFKPFAKFGCLKWGKKFEEYGQRKLIRSGTNQISYSTAEGFIGERVKKTIKMTSIYSFAHGKTKQQYNTIRWRKCRRKFFRKKCRWRTKSVARGLFHNEINLITLALQNWAHGKAVTELTKFGAEELEAEIVGAAAPFGVTQVLSGVAKNDVYSAVDYMMQGAGNSVVKREVEAGLKSGRASYQVKTAKSGVHYTIDVAKEGGSYKLTVKSA